MKIKINPRKTLLTMVWLLTTFYYMLTMLYYVVNNENLLKAKFKLGAVILCLAAILILLFKTKKQVRFSQNLRVTMICLAVFPIFSALFNGQYLSLGVILMAELWVVLLTVFYYATLYYGAFPISKCWIYISYCAILVLSMPLIQLHLAGLGQVGAVIFPVYGCLTILPLILHCTDYHKRYIPIWITLIVILATTKRAGIAAAVSGLVIFYLTDGRTHISVKAKVYRVAKIFLIILICAGLFCVLFPKMAMDIFLRFMSLGSDGGSGRNHIWSTVMAAFRTGDFFHQLFGNGIDAVVHQVVIYSDAYIRAHNDFIEILYDFGYVGLIIMISFLCVLCGEWRKQFKKHTEELSIFSYSMVITVIFMLFSYYFIDSFIINYMAVYWGVIFAEKKIEKNNHIENM